MAKVTVIVPCYNSEEYINKCLDSLVNQTIGIQNMEVICINDASTDNTLELLCKYEEQYPESFLIINNEVNTKQGYARNLAIQYSSGEYITFVDSDDYIDINMLEKMYHLALEGDYDYVSCRYYRVVGGVNHIIDDAPDTAVEYIINTKEAREEFIVDECNNPGCCSTLYNSDFIKNNNLHFAEGIVYEDLLWLGLSHLYAKKVLIIPDRFYFYVDYNNSSVVTKKNSTHHFDRLKAMELYLLECKNRDFYLEYKNAIQMHFLWIYYVNSLTLFADRFDQVPAEILNHILDTIKREMPDYKSNPYVQECNGIAETIFSIIDLNPTTQAAWNEIMKILKEI